MMDMNTDILEFTKSIKIYTFKDEGKVKISFKISSNCVYSDWISIKDFTNICTNWKQGFEDGIETAMGKVFWEHRNCGPRPYREPADYVAIEFNDWSFRISTQEMIELVSEFNTQLTSKNHWD